MTISPIYALMNPDDKPDNEPIEGTMAVVLLGMMAPLEWSKQEDGSWAATSLVVFEHIRLEAHFLLSLVEDGKKTNVWFKMWGGNSEKSYAAHDQVLPMFVDKIAWRIATGTALQGGAG